jgi:hypothetical protein
MKSKNHGMTAKGVLGIYIHNLKDRDGNESSEGRNPFLDDFTRREMGRCFLA